MEPIASDTAQFSRLRRWMRMQLRTHWMLRQDEIMSTYDSFDPSSLTLNPLAARAEAIEAGAAEGEVGAVERALVRRIGRIADKANYDEVSDEWVEEAIIGGTFSGGINTTPVDAGQFATLKLWVRGRTMGERITAVKGVSKRMLDAFERGSLQDELFTSALLVTRQHGQPNLHVQLFRDVPISQVELLFPDVTVAMTTVDKLKIAALGGVGGIAAALKAATVAVAGGADISNGLDAKDAGLVLAGAMLCAVAFQIFSQFQLRKAAFSSALTGALYFKKLGQNRLVIQALVDDTEKQEMKECMLAYALVLNHAHTSRGSGTGTTADELAAHARTFFGSHFSHLNGYSRGSQRAAEGESHLEERSSGRRTFFGATEGESLCGVELDVADALTKLERLGLIERIDAGVTSASSSGARWVALPINDAVRVARQNTEHDGLSFVECGVSHQDRSDFYDADCRYEHSHDG